MTPLPSEKFRVLPGYFAANDATSHARSVLRAGTGLLRHQVVQATTVDCAGSWCSTIGTYEVLDGPTSGMIITVVHGSVHGWDGPIIEDHPGLERVEASSAEQR